MNRFIWMKFQRQSLFFVCFLLLNEFYYIYRYTIIITTKFNSISIPNPQCIPPSPNLSQRQSLERGKNIEVVEIIKDGLEDGKAGGARDKHCSLNKSAYLLAYHLWKLCTLTFFFCLFRATPEACGGSQARGPIGAEATGLCHSHSNAGSKPYLWPTPQLTATPDP